MRAVEESLRRLQTDWIDLYHMHELDPDTPIDETLRALDDLIRAGKVRYIGCSNFPAWRVTEAHHVAKATGTSAFICCQDLYNLLARHHEKDLFPAMRAYGLGLLPFFPLASGMLTGKYRRELPEGGRLTQSRDRRFLNDANTGKVEQLAQFAESNGRTLLDLAFSWLASQPLVASIIAGASRPEQLDVNVASTSWKLTAADMAAVDEITLMN
jgi:aryl-alcohol dehydrogenase-like predicted oxidoreductase